MQHAARNIQHAACNMQHAARAGYHVKMQRCSKLSLPRGDCVQQVYVVCCMTDVRCSHLQRHGNSAQGRSYACQTKTSDWMGWMRATMTHRRAGGLIPATSAPGPGSPLPHLHRDRAHPCHILHREWLSGMAYSRPPVATGPPCASRTTEWRAVRTVSSGVLRVLLRLSGEGRSTHAQAAG
jgi:hypothetical protein